MKKLPAFLAILLLVTFASCKKSVDTKAVEVNAHVIDGGDPAADGVGLYIKVDNSQQIVIPFNLPAEYQKKDINQAVAVKFVETGKTTYRGNSIPGPPISVVYVVSVRKL